jgi:hypothetical protein
MTPPYKVTLINLTAGVTAVAPASDKLELGMLTADEIFQLAGRLLNLDVAAHPKAEPGIIVQRGEKGWRIGAYAGRLRVYKSTSLFDEYWTVESAQALSQLPPFSGQGTGGANTRSTKSRSPQPPRYHAVRSIAEVAGLFLLGVILIVVGFWYGLPHRKVSDLPPDVVVVTGDSEKASVFSAVAGSYVAGKIKPGESALSITPEGRVSLGTIGKDGKFAMPARIDEQARAARKGNVAVVVTKWGFIAELPPDAVNVGNGQWRKVTLNN